MLNRIIHIVILLLMGYGSFSQLSQPEWNIATYDTLSFYDISSDSVFVDNIKANNKDYIGVFYNKDGMEYCAGFSKLDSGVVKIEVSFSSFPEDTFALKDGDSIYFKHWNFNDQCTYRSTLVNGFMDKIMLNAGPMQVESLYSSSVNTPVSFNASYLNNGQTIAPNLTSGSTTNPTLSFSSNDLLIDSNSGNIDLSLVVEGVYEIKITSDVCLNPTLFSFEVIESDNGPETFFNLGDSNSFLSSNSTNSKYNKIKIETTSDEIEVFDKTGRLIISSPVTFDWDGRDQYGKLVPADDYYIKIGETVRVVTVIQ